MYDPFLGSGTTLVAAERHARVCYGMEVDPLYCDVILARWERFSARVAVRVEGEERAGGLAPARALRPLDLDDETVHRPRA